MTKNQILQQVLAEEIPGSTYINSKQIINANDDVHIVNYKLNDEIKTCVIPNYKVEKLEKIDKALTINVLKEVMSADIPNSNYLDYVYTYSTKKYTVFYSSDTTKEASFAITLEQFNEYLEKYNAAQLLIPVDETIEFTETDAIKILLAEEIPLYAIYDRHELNEGEVKEDNFFTVFYHIGQDMSSESSDELFIHIDEQKILDLLANNGDIDADLSQEAKEYFSQNQAESETNLPPRALPFKGKPGVRPKNDKIFNNDWNNVEMDFGGGVTIDEDFSLKYFSTDIDQHEFKKINEEIYSIIRDHPNLSHILPKESEKVKVSKREADKIYLEIRKHLEGKYSEIFIFINVAESLDTSYNTLYEKLPSKLKEVLVRELDEKYKILKKKGLKKLF